MKLHERRKIVLFTKRGLLFLFFDSSAKKNRDQRGAFSFVYSSPTCSSGQAVSVKTLDK